MLVNSSPARSSDTGGSVGGGVGSGPGSSPGFSSGSLTSMISCSSRVSVTRRLEPSARAAWPSYSGQTCQPGSDHSPAGTVCFVTDGRAGWRIFWAMLDETGKKLSAEQAEEAATSFRISESRSSSGRLSRSSSQY